MAELEVELSCDGAGPRAARRALAGWAAPHLDRDVLADAELLVSEVATNAVLHGVGPITLRAALDEERLRVEIVDQGSGFERQLRRDGVDQVGGWGLEFVEDLSARWGVHEGSTHVWFELERRQARSVMAAHARRARDRAA